MVRFAPGNDEHLPSFDSAPHWSDALSPAPLEPEKVRAAHIAEVIEKSGECLGLGDITFAQYMLHWFKWRPDLATHLEGQTLVDLGCGRFAPRMAEFARDAGVSHYIGVDLEYNIFECSLRPPQSMRSSHLAEVPLPRVMERLQTPDFDVTLVQADLLHFISQLPPSSVSITINGIDLSICGDEHFHLVLANEIARVASPRGLVFGSASESLSMLRSLTGTRLDESVDSAGRGLRIAPFLKRDETLGEWTHLTPLNSIMPDDGIFKKGPTAANEGRILRILPASA